LESVIKLAKILVTSAWPYINVTPHLGNLVGSILSADIAARYYRLRGNEVLLVSGSDEHGTPIEVEAIKQGISPKELTDNNHAYVSELFRKWNISYDNYTRTESLVHKKFVQRLLMKIFENGYIFSKEIKMLYCNKDQRFLPDRFIEGTCPNCDYEKARGDQCDQCGKLLEPTNLIDPYCVLCKSSPIIKTTKHWFIDLSKLSNKLKTYLSENNNLPANAKNFSLNWIKEGLKPRAVTRDISWGIPAPFAGAENKTIYVWFEAVLGYISATIEYYKNIKEPEKWREFWFNKNAKTLYFVGKDNIPFHTIILPALLLASGEDYNLPWNVSATEFLQFKGEKASKSQRVGIWIDEALEMFPVDWWRFYLAAIRPETKDSNFSWELFIDKINSDLNDTFGNFIHRTLKFINAKFDNKIPSPSNLSKNDNQLLAKIAESVEKLSLDFENFKFQSAANSLIGLSRIGNQYLNENEPWNLIKNEKRKAGNIFYVASQIVKAIAITSMPIMPNISQQICQILNLSQNKKSLCWEDALTPLDANHQINKSKPLFKKIDSNEKELENKLIMIRNSLS